jgi:hypothetical protein
LKKQIRRKGGAKNNHENLSPLSKQLRDKNIKIKKKGRDDLRKE